MVLKGKEFPASISGEDIIVSIEMGKFGDFLFLKGSTLLTYFPHL